MMTGTNWIATRRESEKEIENLPSVVLLLLAATDWSMNSQCEMRNTHRLMLIGSSRYVHVLNDSCQKQSAPEALIHILKQ